MSSNDAIRLMHAVLDGEATPDEARELEALLEADPALRERHGQWQAMFDAMRRVPPAWPPEGLVAAVMANIPHSPGGPGGQLSAQSRVIGVTSETHRAIPASSATILRSPRTMAPLGEMMSEQSSKRRIWIGAGIAAVAVIVVGGYALDVPPGGKDAVGTIVPVQKFVAPQNTAVDLAARPRSEPGPGNEARPRTEPVPAAGIAAGQADAAARAAAASNAESAAKASAEFGAQAAAAHGAQSAAKASAEFGAQAAAAHGAQSAAKANAEFGAQAAAAHGAQSAAKATAAQQAQSQAKATAAVQAEGMAKK